MEQVLFRLMAGGLLVSVFAALGSIFKPKSFGGLFGAAPSVALATLALTISTEGVSYAATEAHSMMAGAAAFLVYACSVTFLMFRFKPSAVFVTSALLLVWLATAIGIWSVLIR
jgi:uncharacterized membrane protein (GlpM family)